MDSKKTILVNKLYGVTAKRIAETNPTFRDHILSPILKIRNVSRIASNPTINLGIKYSDSIEKMSLELGCNESGYPSNLNNPAKKSQPKNG